MDKFIRGLHEVINYLGSIPDSTWVHLGLFIVSLPVFMGAVELWKRHRKQVLTAEVDIKKVIAKSLLLISGLITVATYFLVYIRTSPTFFVTYPTELVGVATVLYNLRNNVGWLKVKAILGKWSNDGKQLNSEMSNKEPVSTDPGVQTSSLDDLV